MRRNISEKINSNDIYKKLLKIILKAGKSFKNLSTILIVSQLIIASSIIISEPTNVKIFLEKLSRRILWSFDSTQPEDYLTYIKELTSSFIPFSDDLDKISLDIDYEEILKLDCSREYTKSKYGINNEKYLENCDNDIWQKAELRHKDKIYKVKLRSKGDRNIHRINFKKMSFKVDIKGEKRYKGMEEFSIQMPIIRNYITELVAADIMKKEGIISPRHEYIKLFVNGEYFGIRHIEENPSRELIESNKKRYGPLFSLNDEIERWYYDSMFSLSDKKYWHENNNKIAIEARTILERVKNDQILFDKYFDYEIWAKYFAIIDALKLWHGSMPKSVKYYMNPTSGKFEPVFFDGHRNTTRILDDYNFFKILDNPDNQNDFYCQYLCNDKYIFYRRFFGTYEKPNVEFYTKYLLNLDRFTDKNYLKDKLKPSWDKYSTERKKIYRDFWRIDRINNPGIMPYIAPWAEIKKSIKRTNSLIKKSTIIQPEIILNKDKNNISFVRNNISEIPQIIDLKCENDPQIFSYILPMGKLTEIKSKEIINCHYEKLSYSINKLKNYNQIKESYLTYEDKISAYKKDQESKSNLVKFDRKFYEINKPLIIENKDVLINDNTKICLKEKGLIHVINSNVRVNGSKKYPVEIRNCDDDKKIKRGIIMEKSKIFINNLVVDNLNSPNIKLRLLDGGLNFINSEIEVNNLISRNSISEDAINIIDSEFKANRIYIENAKSDAFDSDFSKFSIKNLSCFNIGNDCLDTSFSKGQTKFFNSAEVNDKAISVGEISEIKIEKANISNSEIGIVSKDQSLLKIGEYKYKNVKLPIVSFIKKEEYNSPQIIIEKEMKKPYKNFLISKDSKITISGRRIESKKKSMEIEELLYGNQYGVKTIREK